MSKEFSIYFEHDKYFFPGDNIKGFVKLDLKRSADIQAISLNFKGTAEVNGEKITLVDNTKILATPKKGQKHTVFNKGQIYTFEFLFTLPKDQSLPSRAKIPKIANIQYFLTATPKQRFINFSNSLPTIAEEVKILDFIDVDSPHYREQINMNNDLGFVYGSKSTQWNLVVPKSAFIRGSDINLDCNINNFPPMQKAKAITVSLIRLVYKTSSAKIVEKKVLSSKTVDLHVTEIASTQTVYIKLSIPEETPASVFPNTGKILSISYTLSAELNMKGVKAAIKLKDMYAQEAAIVLGTFTKGDISNNCRSISSERKRTMSNSSLASINVQNMPNSSLISINLQNMPNPSLASISLQNMSSISLTSSRSPTPNHFHSALTHSSAVKPLGRLDEAQASQYNTHRRSYLTRNSSPISGTRNSPPVIGSRTIFGSNDIQLTNMRASYTSAPRNTDRTHTPLPAVRTNGTHTISYSSPHSRRPLNIFQRTPSDIIVSSPHEIGPNDVINRGGTVCEEYFPEGKNDLNYHGEKAIDYEGDKVISYDGEKEEAQVPHLIRHDTISTASSSEHLEYQYPRTPASFLIRNKPHD